MQQLGPRYHRGCSAKEHNAPSRQGVSRSHNPARSVSRRTPDFNARVDGAAAIFRQTASASRRLFGQSGCYALHTAPIIGRVQAQSLNDFTPPYAPRLTNPGY